MFQPSYLENQQLYLKSLVAQLVRKEGLVVTVCWHYVPPPERSRAIPPNVAISSCRVHPPLSPWQVVKTISSPPCGD